MRAVINLISVEEKSVGGMLLMQMDAGEEEDRFGGSWWYVVSEG